jgi:integrase/recombinase XerD
MKAAIILDPTRKRADGKNPVRLRLLQRQRTGNKVKDLKHLIGIKFSNPENLPDLTRMANVLGFKLNDYISLTPKEWEQTYSKAPKGVFKTLRAYLSAIDAQAEKIIQSIDNITFKTFVETFTNKIKSENDLLTDLLEAHKQLTDQGRISTATAYKCAYQSIKQFHEMELPYENITVEWLASYEKWMLGNGNKATTVGIYLRNVRALYNARIKDGKIDTKLYPFKKGSYQIPTGSNVKKALTIDQIRLLAAYEPFPDADMFYRDLWLFSYFCNGMNLKDISRLKYKNIDSETISFTRAKTERTKTGRIIQIPLTPQTKQIIDKWGITPKLKESYVFPVLQTGITPKQEYAKIQQVVKMVNKYVEMAAKAVGIEAKVTSYTARHSFATVLKRSGASIEFISESLGHTDLKTTENYLANFELDEKKKWAAKLI